MISKQQQEKIRNDYQQAIFSKILGPGSETITDDNEHEIISESPRQRYVTGILFPKETDKKDEETEDNMQEGFDPEADPIIANNDNKPSSMGLSFYCNKINKLNIRIKGATYEKIQNPPISLPEEIIPEFKQRVFENENLKDIITLDEDKKTFSYVQDYIDDPVPKQKQVMDFLKEQEKNNQDKVRSYLQKLVSINRIKGKKATKISLPKKLIAEFKQQVFEEGHLEDIITLNEEKGQFKFADGYLKKTNLFQKRISEFYETLPNESKIKPYIEKLKKKITITSYFVRKPFNFVKEVDLKEVALTKPPFRQNLVLSYSENNNSDKQNELSLVTIVRHPTAEIIAPTIVLENCSRQPVFQSELSVEAKDGLVFKASEDISVPRAERLQDEEAKLLFSYQAKKTYAFGHGVSATWEPIGSDRQPNIIKTSYVPTYDIMPTSFDIQGLDKDILHPSSYLFTKNKNQQIDYLNQFVDSYDQWIKEKSKQISSYTHGNKLFIKFAEDNIKDCKKCSKRMRKGIKALSSDADLLKAFDLSNEAILLQRLKNRETKISCYARHKYDEKGQEIFSWRPFQLAFILTTLCSVVYEEDEDRNDLDLIWITTGGGKTEAYLFAIAVSILYRRILDPEAKGVSVIMRYTLRLLTAQQFERASALICALEYMRRNQSDLGETPISIGLWVGGKTTPNDSKAAKDKFKTMMNSGSDSENAFQILRCPWCFEKHSLVPEKKDNSNNWGYMPATRKHSDYDMKCQNKDCEFTSGLPIYVVDERIYKQQPTVLFGTVDKFAQVPIKEETNRLFKATNEKNGKTYYPELVIQDELHLISGPLGSIVGLYEAGFDYIMQQSGKMPKYLASTATIRNSIEQIRNLYNRPVNQFPPDGLEAEDSFFVKTIKSDDCKSNFGRRYVGVMGTGKTQVTTEVHLLGAMLSSINELGLDSEQQDLFWTLVGYFNSIRELGKASTLLLDDVGDELERIARRNDPSTRRYLDRNKELTSRISSGKIANIIKELEEPHKSKHHAIDTVIATNMISVGIDISRLNNMLVIGQPKLTSEYIQATSRVGRETLGLVCTLYNAARSRDRSHYETFTSYHQSMYRYVEPSSVTPFSKPSLKKAVAAVITAMVRHTEPNLLGKNKAGYIQNHGKDYGETLNKIENYLISRIKVNDEQNLYLNNAEEIIKDFIEDWQCLANETDKDGKELAYYIARESEKPRLLTSYDCEENNSEYTHNVMNSMRDVEETSSLLIEGEVGNVE